MSSPPIDTRGALLRLVGVVLVVLGALDSMLAWRGGFAVTNLYLLLLAGGVFLFALGAARRTARPLARISHRSTAAVADPSVLAGRTPCSRLDVVSATPSPSSGPCFRPGQRLDALASRIGEISGLAGRAGPTPGPGTSRTEEP